MGQLMLPKAIIFDIDGTLAIRDEALRGPYDMTKVGLDKPNTIVVEMLLGYRNWGYSIIIVSGREDFCQKETVEWLAKHGIVCDKLIMRKTKDGRKDADIKAEIYWTQIWPHYNVKAVVDDRPQVCRMWREKGLPVIQIGDPYKEF